MKRLEIYVDRSVDGSCYEKDLAKLNKGALIVRTNILNFLSTIWIRAGYVIYLKEKDGYIIFSKREDKHGRYIAKIYNNNNDLIDEYINIRETNNIMKMYLCKVFSI